MTDNLGDMDDACLLPRLATWDGLWLGGDWTTYVLGAAEIVGSRADEAD